MADLAVEHLLLRLRPVRRALGYAARVRTSATSSLGLTELRELCVSPREVEALLEALGGEERSTERPPQDLTDEELAAQQELRAQARQLGIELPIDAMQASLGLAKHEIHAVLLCAAVEIDSAYERIFSFILDDLNRRWPCIELLCRVTAGGARERLLRRHALGPFGTLRRCQVLRPFGEEDTELRRPLRLTERAFHYILGDGGYRAAEAFRDPDEVPLPEALAPPPHLAGRQLESIGAALREGRVQVVGLWGPAQYGLRPALFTLARIARKRLRQLPRSLWTQGADVEAIITEATGAARALEALLWVRADELLNGAGLHDRLSEAVCAQPCAICITARHPWRPTPLLRDLAYAELTLTEPEFEHRVSCWQGTIPELGRDRAIELASRYRMGPEEVTAVGRVARTAAHLSENGHRVSIADLAGAAASTVARKKSGRHVLVIEPRRTIDDLVLPEPIKCQVLDVAGFFDAWCRVREQWGFGHQLSGGGVKALFTGESGTGKTMAAEVIAGHLGLTLLKVDLAQIVSKWIGETEKNLESAFDEAGDSHAVLFFDEADALFGKRGEVERGTDRYANLEVSYLLQKLEDYSGLVILASNLKDQIDQAFLRRFHVVVHVPRPRYEERRRIWERSFPARVPTAPDLDLAMLSRLELTGAGIAGAARMATLMAAQEGADVIRMEHVVRAVARHFQHEARLLAPADLGEYASLVHGEP